MHAEKHSEIAKTIHLSEYRELKEAGEAQRDRSVLALEHCSAAVSIYEASSLLLHEADLQFVQPAIRPPHELSTPADLELPGARDFYARFITLARKVDPQTGEERIIEDQYQAAQHLYILLRPTSVVLRHILKRTEATRIQPKAYRHTIKVLDLLAEDVRAGNTKL